MMSDKRVVQIFRRAVNKAKNINRFTKQGSSVEGFFASKGAAIAIPDGDFARKASLKGGELQSHLQGMVNLIRDEDTMRLVVKVESEAKYTRYLCIVTTYGLSDEEESVILGFDWIEDEVTLGLVIPLWSNVSTKLDGDGGFEIKTEQRNYIFKPVSVQTLWTALLWIHKCLNTAHKAKHFDGGLSHAWLDYYQNRISSPRVCINFWESMDELENKKEVSYSYFDKVKTDEELLKGSIRNKLKEILTRFDLEEVTCRQVREALEAEMKMSLQHLKGYVDEQLFVILGQMESSSKITDHLYLGSEWNACNLQELKDNRVGYILNITKEVDNFFPGTFDYMNVRLYDVKEADLMSHWGKTYRFIHKAKEHDVAALVHCRRGISRSASTVIAYLMKESNMTLSDAMKFVKNKRSIVQPNSGFWKQLIIYEGILKSSRNRHNSLFRRRSNSDSSNIRRTHKKGRHNNGADNVDSSEHAHTMPRMSNEVPPEGEGVVLRGEGPSDEDVVDSISDEELSSSSNEEEPENKRKIRRTVSEPAMMSAADVRLTSPTSGKPRSRTFADRQASVVRSPTSIIEDAEEDDVIWIDMVKERGDVSQEKVDAINQEAEVKVSSIDDCVTSESVVEIEVQPDAVEDDVENVVNGSPEVNDTTDTHVNDTASKDLSSHDQVEMTSCDVTHVPCVDPTRVDSPLEVSQHDDSSRVESPLDDSSSCVESPLDDSSRVESPLKESPREEYPLNSDYDTPPRTPRQRSRSIGEKLVDKHLVKQSRSESSDNLKKVHVRGRVRRRERKAKSDLQLTSSGFVKRHTQIIEEQMLYSLLMNSEDTLATLAWDFWESNTKQKSDVNSVNNVDLEKDCIVTSVTDFEKNPQSQKEEIVSENNSQICEELEFCKKCDSQDLENVIQENLVKHVEESCEEKLAQCCNTSRNNSVNISEQNQTASQELKTIVQEVNAEAKRDIKTGADSMRAPVVSQNELRHASESDDVCIDQMAWIDLTHHHGDVVKRRSAAFENNAKNKCGNKAIMSQSREEQEVNMREDVSVDENAKSVTDQSTDVPKLDLDDSTNDESFMVRSNSIMVEDYNSWERSSVRDRTKILENIIAKTGGSFPSPRSRVSQDRLNSETRLQQELSELDLNASSEEDRTLSPPLGTTLEENVYNDAPVKSLVDKFEGKSGDSE